MLSKLFILILALSTPVQAELFEAIDCTSGKDLNLEPNKRYQKPAAKFQYDKTGYAAFLAKSNDDASIRTVKTRITDINTGSYQVTQVHIMPYASTVKELEHYEVTPFVTLRLGKMLLTGADFGERGGEVMLLSDSGKAERLAEVRVDNIYQMPFGVIVVSTDPGIRGDKGDIWLLNNDSKLTSLFTITQPYKSHQLLNGDILLASYRNHYELLTQSGELKRVTCK